MKKKIWIHLGMVVAMLGVAVIYFSPVMVGKMIYQGDIQKYEAMAKETKDYHARTGDYTLWNSRMFGGMPTYQVGGNPPSQSIFTPLQRIGTLQVFGVDASRTIGVLFFYLIGFYIALLVLGCSPWLSLLGALAFGLGSYNIIIVEAGHITKAWALAMTAPILAGMVLCLRREKGGEHVADGDVRAPRGGKRKDWLWGGLLFTTALGLQLMCNHIQITYYTIIGAVALGMVYLVYSLKERFFRELAIGTGILLVGCGLAFACNARTLMISQQYAQQTMRGGNAITVTPEELYHDNEPAPKSGKQGGLDIDYAFSWSYGVGETYTLLVPGAMGGGSGEPAKKGSKYAQLVDQQPMATYQKEQYKDNAPYYWGGQPFTSGPVYFGAIVIFLFILGLLVVKGPERWWLTIAAVIAIVMSWGHNFMALNEWLFNTLPMYNKFRTPSMSLVLANVTMVILGILALKRLFSGKMESKKAFRALYVAGGVTAGILLAGMVVGTMLPYTSSSDAQMDESLRSLLMEDRRALFMSDSWRSLIFVVLAFAALWFYLRLSSKAGKPLSASKPGIFAGIALALVVLVVADLWNVDRRYLNDKKYVDANSLTLREAEYDRAIDQLAAQYGDKDYRALNLSVNTFNDSKPSAFHRQVGGYSAVKMRRYQDIIDFYLSRHISMPVLNMLNTRYIVLQNGQVQRNPEALGNAWFVRDVKWVEDANGEILALNDFDPATTAIVNRNEFSLGENESAIDSADYIVMEHQTPYNPGYLRYKSHSMDEQLAVFSEIYYEPDWRAYIDGKPAQYLRANYILRAIVVPAGDHVIEFKNEAPLFHKMNMVTLAGSIVLVLLACGAIVVVYRRKE